MEALSSGTLAAPSNVRLVVGDVRAMLAHLEPESVQCCVTSPPYWGLRAYGTEPQVWGGDREHAHEWASEAVYAELGRGNWSQGVNGRGEVQPGGVAAKREPISTTRHVGFCACGAWLGELGSEPTPELYVEHLVDVFRAVRRVLRKDGVLFVNLGDSYAGSGKGPSNSLNKHNEHSHVAAETMKRNTAQFANGQAPTTWLSVPQGLKPKDLVGIPWRVALALQADGWYWRSTIVWAKRSCMPESVRDRPTNAWEPILLFSRSARYFWDAEAMREPHQDAAGPPERFGNTGALGGNNGTGPKTLSRTEGDGRGDFAKRPGGREYNPNGRSMRNVWDLRGEPISDFWSLGPEPFPGAHFATFPTEVPRRCILAGSRLGDTVLDPFAGAGTTLMVAARLGRDSVGIELNSQYAQMAADRIRADAGFMATVEVEE